MGFISIFFFLICSISIFSPISLCNGSDTISDAQPLLPNQTIISKNGRFELGFFSPANSTNYYVGIWYKTIPVRTVVWVLNRNQPIKSSFHHTSLLQMSNGRLNLVVSSQVIWSSVVSLYVTEAVILDSGNFILRNSSSAFLWQSFDNPTDTWLPGAVVGFNFYSGQESKLISWRDVDDPSTGEYSLEMEPNGGGELFIKSRNGTEKTWRSGIWQGGTLPAFSPLSRLYNFSFSSQDGASFLEYNANNESLVVRVSLGYNGVINHFSWLEEREQWVILAFQPSDFCKTYASCGANAICDIMQSPACQCLHGFAPRSAGEWSISDYSGGCRRRRPLDCNEGTTVFIEVPNITFPAYAETLEIRRDGVCELLCRVNCSCTAYAYGRGGGCLLFTGDLIDSQKVVTDSGTTVFVRMSSGDRPAQGKRRVAVVAFVVPITCGMLVVLGICICYFRWRRLKNREPRKLRKNVLPRDLKTYVPAYYTRASVRKSERGDQSDEYDLPLFSLASITASTNNFSSSSKLGEGGFGPVYKAELANDQFVAVKKLSRTSGQGLEEFKNEIELIAKLQHRNLVGILGCCVENEEKILVYEYMPNKSLDFFLFDQVKKARLNWISRVNIIEGIAQGLLYLHHYSPLRIVHRDLKASNILLDAEMNPKISDFGMARIFRGDDLQANTKRVVGTYGYMSPEYAIEGRFSLKSDVFAFGVLVLEIISGKKNTDFYGTDYLSLLGYTWNMWKQERGLELVDPILEIRSSSSAALRYIKIGLLCVQENPNNRPLMADIVAMLSNQETRIESPRPPAFGVGRALGDEVEIGSSNGLTISHMEAR